MHAVVVTDMRLFYVRWGLTSPRLGNLFIGGYNIVSWR